MRAGMPAEFLPHTNGVDGKMNSDLHQDLYNNSTAMLLRRSNPTHSLEEDGLSSRDGGSVVVGVIMVDDRFHGHKGVDSKPLVLGSILLNRRQPLDSIKTEELRRHILTQVPSLPGNFCFLTKDGWPLMHDQEKMVHVDQVVTDNNAITIRKLFEKTRFGVMTSNGDCLGFIFIEINASLRQVRGAIDEQLKDDKPLKSEYKFLERHGWPVTLQQEALLMVADILANCNLHIHFITTNPLALSPIISSNPMSMVATRAISPGRRLSPAGHTFSLPLITPDEPDNRTIIPEIKTKKKYRPTFRIDPRPTKEVTDTLSRLKQNLVAKPILISYVRAEAGQHAINMKKELNHMGYNVYLDVDEIKSGNDWQDALNFAVTNCDVFVPLITPMYGKTLWTNREVKLADVLNKFIMPINFLEQWPPECLAIQFASTQYIPWKLPTEGGDHVKSIEAADNKTLCSHMSGDYRHWDVKHIKRVAEEIDKRCKKDIKDNNRLKDPTKVPQRENISIYSVARLSMIRASRARMPSDPEELQSMKEEIDGRNRLVVISAHPRQLLFASQLKTLLEQCKYEVWCSTELLEDNYLDVDSIGTMNSGQLTPILEGQTLQRSNKKPLVRTESDYMVEKKALVRLSSQLSQASVMSYSLSPNKIAQLKKFQQKADQAGVVIIVVSEAYTKSTTSQQQVFYCEHRLQSILVKVDNHNVPTIFSQLMGNDMLTTVDNAQFECALKTKVKRALDPASAETPKDANMESKMQYLVKFMKKNLPMIDSCVYISGSSRLLSERSKEICTEIGKALSNVQNLNVVTGGFYGAGELVATAFNEKLIDRPRSWDDPGPVVHILPFKDVKDFSTKARQNEGGTFDPVPYGKNLFVGDSVKEREAVVARLFDICIVIEGGPGAAHEVEEFIWNDHFVIPIISTGGAAGGQFGVPLKILETPPGVAEEDWCILSEKEASPKTVANAVVRIVIALKEAIVTHAMAQELQAKRNKMASKASKANKKRSKRSKKLAAQQQMQAEQYTQLNSSISDVRMDKSVSMEMQQNLVSDSDKTDISCTGHGTNSRWHKFVTYFRPTRLMKT